MYITFIVSLKFEISHSFKTCLLSTYSYTFLCYVVIIVIIVIHVVFITMSFDVYFVLYFLFLKFLIYILPLLKICKKKAEISSLFRYSQS